MLLTKEVESGLGGKNLKHYESLGYIIPRAISKRGILGVPKGTKLLVKVEDLLEGSTEEIECLCDYCLSKGINTILKKEYRNYILDNKKSIIHKDCCYECRSLKVIESNEITYDCQNVFQLESTKIKSKETNLNNYNVEYITQSGDIQDKIKITNISKFGCEYVFNSKTIIEKTKATNLLRYGFEIPQKNIDIKEKTRQTNLKRYGYSYPLQNPIIRAKILKTLYKNSSQKASNQQRYICKLLDHSELNYLVSRMFLDIAFVEEKIFVEYDGGFHNGSVIMGNISQEDFDKKELRRSFYLRDLGWKEIRIISISDLLPSDEVILNMINSAKEYFNAGHRWINFDIDNGKIICSQSNLDFDYGDLRKIKGRDLEEVI